MEIFQIGKKHIAGDQIKKITSEIDEVISKNLQKNDITFDVISFIIQEYLEHIKSKNINL